jgi:hypothetical protein
VCCLGLKDIGDQDGLEAGDGRGGEGTASGDLLAWAWLGRIVVAHEVVAVWRWRICWLLSLHVIVRRVAVEEDAHRAEPVFVTEPSFERGEPRIEKSS